MREYLTEKIRTLAQCERGASAFIIGSGPSVSQLDLARLRGCLCIGMNASTRLEHKAGFVCKYYALSDSRFIGDPSKRECAYEMLDPTTVRVCRAELADYEPKEWHERTHYVEALGRDGFSDNLESGFYFGATTAMLALQLAYYMSVREVFLLGIDLNYYSNTPRFYDEAVKFDWDCLTSVQIQNICLAQEAYRDAGISLYVCSEESWLRPYVQFLPYEEALTMAIHHLDRDSGGL